MLTGYTDARAIPGYFLIEPALYKLLMKSILNRYISYNVDAVSYESHTDVRLEQDHHDSDNYTLVTQQQEEIKQLYEGLLTPIFYHCRCRNTSMFQ